MKKYKALFFLTAALLLFAVYVLGGDEGRQKGADVQTRPAAAWQTEAASEGDTTTETAPQEGTTTEAAPEEDTATEAPPACTIRISCEAVLSHMDQLETGIREMLPGDGVILRETEIALSQDMSVFDVLLQVCRKEKIHLEFSTVPVYGSAYIEGIFNLYEFDCGGLSGWLYAVNGVFPEVACSSYMVSPGDQIAFLYTCDLGNNVKQGLQED